MPRTTKKKEGALGLNPADVSLNDFANCKTTGKKLRKPISNSFTRIVKSTKNSSENEEWMGVASEDDELSQMLDSSNKKKVKGRLKERREATDASTGRDYPLDLWFLLSDYVKPEDVSVFATICKRSRYVVRTYKFWICLYKRFYKPTLPLPDHLQPLQIERPHLIKFNVVRALHYFYPPFVQRKPGSAPSLSSDNEAHNLVHLKCVNLWHSNLPNGKWAFFFKFQEGYKGLQKKLFTPQRAANYQQEFRGSWDKDDDDNSLSKDWLKFINANPEEGCHILCVSSANYAALTPKVMGHCLAEIRISLCSDLRGHRIHLAFASSSYRGPSKTDCVQIDIDPADNIQVVRWWHPQYPHHQVN